MAQIDFDKVLEGTRHRVSIHYASQYGAWENVITGDEGGLWFKGLDLLDYDGAYNLPKEVIDLLRVEGYRVEPGFENNPDLTDTGRA